MTLAATFLGGARSRLLPASIPFSFFAAAIVFHVAGWAVLAASAGEVADFVGGLGLPLAALHLITLGVLTMTAIGAALQLLPVATRQSLPALWPLRLIWASLVPGVVLLGHGMAVGAMSTLVAGAAAVALALLAAVIILADNLRRARSLPVVAGYGWTALIAVVLALVLGVTLAVDFGEGFVGDRRALASAHVVVAAYGFMGMLALGFSYVLVPMFALSPAPSLRLSWTGLGIAVSALLLGVGGLIIARDGIVAVACGVGLGAVSIYLWTMRQILTTRMRKRLGLSFVLIRIAWGLLPVSLLLGAASVLGMGGPRASTLFGFVLIYGWLLTFMFGVLQRILPFLASMHGSRRGGKVPLVSELTAEGPLKVHAACHIGALLLICMGIAIDEVALIRVGGLAGLIGALAFAIFALLLAVRALSGRRRVTPVPGV